VEQEEEDAPASDLDAFADAERSRRRESGEGISTGDERVLLAELVDEESRERLGCRGARSESVRGSTRSERER